MSLTLNRVQRKVLEQFFLFEGAGEQPAQLCLSDERCSVRSYEKGERIFTPTDYTRGIALILSGRVQVTKQPQPGQQLMMSTLEPGYVFGAATLYSDSDVYFTTLTAVTDAVVLHMPEDFIQELLRSDFRITENYLRYLAHRIAFLSSRIDSLSPMSGSGKLLNWLRERADTHGQVQLKLSMTVLAATLSMGRASLYRAFDQLEKLRLIRREGKTVTIL